MSADDTAEDKAKARAEERAERELQLKIDALELEREKFRYTRRQAASDRMSAAAVRAAAALLFGHGSVLVVCLTSYKSIIETITKPVFQRDVGLLVMGFICAMAAFSTALTLSAVSFGHEKKSYLSWMAGLYAFGISSIASFVLLGWMLASSLKALKGS